MMTTRPLKIPSSILNSFNFTSSPRLIKTTTKSQLNMQTQVSVNMTESFKLQWRGIHLTYKTHLSLQELLQHLQLTIPDIIHYSIVHENGKQTSEEDNENERYEHTHAAIWCSKRHCTKDPRKFDFGGIHPHIKRVRDIKHYAELHCNYHRKEPVSLQQSDFDPSCTGNSKRPVESDACVIAKKARTIGEAANLLGIEIRTIADIQIIRNDKPLQQPEEHRFESTSFTLEVPEHHRVLYLYGPSGTGKTEWAIHRFQHPLLIFTADELRKLDPSIHDGFVWDEFSPGKFSGEEIIRCFQHDRSSCLPARYNNAIIPAGMRRVFTSNISFEDNVLSRVRPEQRDAVKRRVHVVHVHGPTFSKEVEMTEDIPWENLFDPNDFDESVDLDIDNL